MAHKSLLIRKLCKIQRNSLVFVAVALGLLLVGCASAPKTSLPDAQQAQQKRQAVQSEPLTAEQEQTMARAEAAMASGQWEQASRLFQSLRSVRPNHSEIHANLGWISRQQGNSDLALSSYRKAFDLNPQDAVSANNLSLLLREKGRFKEAVAVLKEGLEYSPGTAELHYNLAVIAELYLLDLRTALEHYKAYQAITKEDEQQVAGWIADLERRTN